MTVGSFGNYRALLLVGVVLSIGALYPRDRALGNHGWLAVADGVGFEGLGSTLQYVDVYATANTSLDAESLMAVEAWRAVRVEGTANGTIWWVSTTDVGSSAEIEVLDAGNDSQWPSHTEPCASHFVDFPLSLATAVVFDEVGQRGIDSDGYWARRAQPRQFLRASACLNLNHPTLSNDRGTIAHEIGHALGLDHITTAGADCPEPQPEQHLNSVMAYNYTAPASWAARWPENPLETDPTLQGPFRRPTSADIWGPRICAIAEAGGLAHVYQIGPDNGLPSSINSDADSSGCTNREEAGGNPMLGGQRNPTIFWDFYDVNFSGKVDSVDIGLVRSNFNGVGPTPPEDLIYDRAPGPYGWAPSGPNNVINSIDIALVRASFNHSCVAP